MQTTRLTLKTLPSVIPTPTELYDELLSSPGWKYKTNQAFFRSRDLALASLLYVAALRSSEVIQLRKGQFGDPIKNKRGHYIPLSRILLSKRKAGKVETNDLELPLEGERVRFTQLIIDYLDQLPTVERNQKGEITNDYRLFPWSLRKVKIPIKGKNRFYQNKQGENVQRYSVQMIGTHRAWEIVKKLLPKYTEHYLRAFGEDYFYELSGKDVIATAAHYKVDPLTLAKWYLGRRHLDVPIR